MYFLTACLIVLVLSAVVSFRRSRLLSRNFQGRLAAIWPSLSAREFVRWGWSDLIMFKTSETLLPPRRSISWCLLALSLPVGSLASLRKTTFKIRLPGTESLHGLAGWI